MGFLPTATTITSEGLCTDAYLEASIGRSSLHTRVWCGFNVACRSQQSCQQSFRCICGGPNLTRAVPRANKSQEEGLKHLVGTKLSLNEGDHEAGNFTCADQIWSTQQRAIHHSSIFIHSVLGSRSPVHSQSCFDRPEAFAIRSWFHSENVHHAWS